MSVNEERFELHQRLSQAAMIYTDALSVYTSFETTMAAAQELEDAADAWAARPGRDRE
jgi:hypothetical protein